jgi:hypothetical protein
MTFKEIFSQTIVHWPERIDFSDGILIAAKKTHQGHLLRTSEADGFFSASLSGQFNEVKARTAKDNVYQEQMLWTLYQYLINTCRDLTTKNIFHFYLKDIDKTVLEESFYKNLSDGFYDIELAAYERII